MTAAVDIVLELSRPEGAGAKTNRVLRALSRFQATPEELVIDYTPTGYVVLGTVSDARAEVERDVISEALGDGVEPMSAEELADVLDVPKATVHKRLGELLEEGSVTRSGAGVRGDAYRWQPAGFDSSREDPGGTKRIDAA